MSNQLETKTIKNTDVEYMIPAGEVVYSTTDPAGRIKTFNRTFLEASGYTPDELIGKTHGVIKHPDMPTVVFDDIWETITSGNIWTGVIKNRRKDGSYYWVDSSITPIIEDGFISGYASIRYSISRDKAKKAGAYYQAVKEGKAKYTSTKNKISQLSEIDSRQKMNYYLGSAILAMIFACATVLFNIYIEPLSWTVFAVVASALLMLGILYKINQFVLLDERNDVYNAIKDLSVGKFRNKFSIKSRFTPHLDLIRIRNANMNAMMSDCEYTKSLNDAIMDNILGSVVITDYHFTITDYNLSSSSNLIGKQTQDELNNRESFLQSLSGTNISKFIPHHQRDVLKKRETIIEQICINDINYRTIIKSIKVHDEIKGWVFIFYKINENGELLNIADRRQR